MIIKVTAKRHPIINSPIAFAIDGLEKFEKPGLKDTASGKTIPAQVDNGKLVWIKENIPLGKTKEYELINNSSAISGVELVEKTEQIEFLIDGKLFTSYHFKGDGMVRPYLWPVHGPDEMLVTRNYPMDTTVEGEKQDHPHHKSIYVAHGDLNGSDNWSEEPGHAYQVHKVFLEKTSGPVFARIKSVNDWTDNQYRKVIEEERTITIYNLPNTARMIDMQVIFKATEGDVRFGDTKEGGLASVRVATSMDGERGGLITNAIGGITEAENWGKPSHWVDYTGPVQGKTVGIAIFDTPGNFRYPTRWHVRDYGLFSANPFALSHYLNDPGIDGGHTVKSGETFPFKYRIFIHSGDTRSACVSDVYHAYINPPDIAVE